MAYGMPPAKAEVDSRAAQLIGFPREFMVPPVLSEPMRLRTFAVTLELDIPVTTSHTFSFLLSQVTYTNMEVSPM